MPQGEKDIVFLLFLHEKSIYFSLIDRYIFPYPVPDHFGISEEMFPRPIFAYPELVTSKF
jgi:hypothetical protein